MARVLSRSLLCAAVLWTLTGTSHAENTKVAAFNDHAISRTTKFSFEHKRYMFSRQGPGSVAYVPAGVKTDKALPLVVFLHGLNETEKENPEFDQTPLDPRLVADELVADGRTAPFLLAAPTHSRYARGTRVMWHDFDLAAFVNATEAALDGRAHIDRDRIVLVGHSGGGCNPDGGLLAPNMKLHAALAIDTCLDDKTMPKLLDLARTTPVYFGYQRSVWQRPFEEFSAACERVAHCKTREFSGFHQNPHREVLKAALQGFLPEVLPVPTELPTRVSSAPTSEPPARRGRRPRA